MDDTNKLDHSRGPRHHDAASISFLPAYGSSSLRVRCYVQVLLGSSHGGQDEHHPHPTATVGDVDLTEWSFDVLPNPNATDHLVFETVYSLLQHWPNTRMRNGHNIVPGNIPKGTLLYHGAAQHQLPSDPDWVATDPEHSYIFCRDLSKHFRQGCWSLTLATTRPLNVIYFDGSSAAKLPYGPLDTQDLIAWGKVGSDTMAGEMQRIQDLCEWGKNFGVDGFDGNGFIMLCNFTSGVSVVSFSNLVRQVSARTKPTLTMSEVMNAGSWHNHFPGETRVQLNLAGLISFYDTQLVPSLIAIRAGQERWDHRVQNISSGDLSALKSRLEAVLIRTTNHSSGIDWQTLIQVIVDRYAQRLELVRYFLNLSTVDPTEILDVARKTQSQLRIMLTPYILFSATPTDPSDKTDLQWTIPIYKLCSTTHTYSMESDIDLMTDSEKLILQAVRGTTREICRVITKMWAEGVYAGIEPSLNAKEAPDVTEVNCVLGGWRKDLMDLMGWLDWNVWVKCDLECGPEEMCWLPTWPVGFPRGRGPPPDSPAPGPDRPRGPPPERLTSSNLRTMAMENLAEAMQSIIQPGPDDWIRPQPRCIRRTDPYEV